MLSTWLTPSTMSSQALLSFSSSSLTLVRVSSNQGLFKGDVHSHESAPYLILPILWAPVVSSYS